MAEEDDVRVGVAADLDEASVDRAGEQFARIFEKALADAAPQIARTIQRSLGAALRQRNQGVFDGLLGDARAAANNARAVADSLASVQQGAQQATQGFAGMSDRVQETARRMQRLREDTEAFQDRVAAARKLLEAGGASPDLLRVFDRELHNTQARLRQFDAEAEQILSDPIRLDGLEAGLREGNKAVFRELGILQTLLRNLNTERRFELNRLNAADDRAGRERIQNARIEASQRIVTEQGANAKILAETRIAGQQQLQQERIRARTRIEIIRFTFNQIRTLERGIAGVFRATGTIANSAVRTLENAIGRIGNLFRRTNSDLNQGLAGALRTREVTISRSFDRQTRSISSSVAQQSAIVNRFEAQASTGVAGALTGRSQLGTLIGGGVAVGGGFALFQGLREGLQVGGDFVQGLAVLQAQLELTEAQMQAVREQSIELGNDITLPGVSALDAAQAIQIASKQFASLGDAALPAAQAAARGILQLSRATATSAEDAARVVGAAVNVFGVNANEATLVADQVTNALKNAAGVGFNEFSDAFTQAASVVNLFIGPAQDATSALAETNAAIAVLARGGIIGSDAGTSLKQFFLQANRGTADANEKLAEVAERAGVVGSVFFDEAGNARTLAASVNILRDGLDGLSDQQRSLTLQKLFGSDAARAAAILVSTTEGEFRKLIEANLELGTAAEIAAAQNVGLRGALDALGSVIETQQIRTYERYQEQLGRVVLRFAELLDAFFAGEGVFAVVRAGLSGIAIALGGLLAAKTAAEGIQFLAIALRALVTPLGLVVGGFVALGAGISILREVSPEFRTETNRIGGALRGNLSDAVGGLGGALAEVASIIRVDVLPFLLTLATSAVRLVAPAFEAIGGVIETASLVLDSFISAASGDGITTGSDSIFGIAERLGALVFSLGTATDAFVRTLSGRDVELVDPEAGDRLVAIQQAGIEAAEAVRSVGDAAAGVVGRIGDIAGAVIDLAATGDFAPLRNRIVDAFTGLGRFVIAEITPQLRAIVAFIDNFLSGGSGVAGQIGNAARNFLLGPFQTAARELGFFLGNLVTDPRLLEALAQLAALAVLTGANFVLGVAEGIASNVGGLADTVERYVGDALGAGVRAALANPFTFAQILAAALVGSRLLAVWRTFGEKGGKETAKGLRTGLSESLSRSVSGSNNPFLNGLFGGVDRIEADAARVARRAGDAALREQARYGERLKLLGQEIQVSFGQDGAEIDTRRQFDELERRLGRAGIAGASMRASIGQAFTDIRGFGAATGLAVQGQFRDAARSAGASFGSLRSTVATALRNVADDARQIAGGIGQALGGALVAGVGAALSGRALGGASNGVDAGIGLAGIISSALFAGAAFGGATPAGVLAASAVATIGLVTAAWQRNKQAAEEAAQRVQVYTDILLQNRDVASAIPDISDQISAVFRQESEGIQDFLVRTRLTADQFADLFSEGVVTAGDAARLFGSRIGATGRDVDQFAAFIEDASSKADILNALSNTGFGRNFADDLEAAGISASEFADLLIVVREQSFALQGAVGTAEFDRAFNPERPEAFAAQVDNIAFALGKAGRSAEGALEGINTDIAGLTEAIAPVPSIFDDATAAIEFLNQQRLTEINTQIAETRTELELAQTAASAARDNLAAYFNGNYADTSQQALDNLLLSLPNVARQFDEALTLTPTLEDAQIASLLAGFRDQIGTVVQAGINDGTITAGDPASIRAALAPLETAFGELLSRSVEDGGISPAAAAALRGEIGALLEGESLDLLTDAVFDAEAEVARIQDRLNAYDAELKIRAVFDLTQINAALRQLGLPTIAALPSFLGSPTTADAAERAALVAAQRDAAAAANGTAAAGSVASSPELDRGGITVQQLNIYEAQSARATGREAVLALGSVAGGVAPTTRTRTLSSLTTSGGRRRGAT